ncbi:MAG: ABC transporter ATP-binding protein [Alphaproteobacteria bacterium]|nr:ABC transporter ATP-binding protein [Alphaproteobacteria bacterium]
MITVDAPEIALGRRVVLRDVALRIAPGECVAVCGPNGAGKSTLLRAIAGLLPGMARRDPCRVAYVPQGARSAWGMTVAEIVALGRIPHGDRDATRIEAAMAQCGVLHLSSQRIDRISGGQARRAMLARVFATAPAVFLLDEPTADLDPAAAHEIMALLRATAAGGATVVVALHALDLAVRYATRMLVVAEGRVAADAAPAEALPAAAAAFGMSLGEGPDWQLLPP